ncbi:hypothetical protein SJ05684_a38660 (plasmid) [Sinorhizobium sojae CCBAU 05684]|uniref:Uncharacterized protein n=1 Tax=Sinorhizobium sojae CCBAU 05684 TaxID=716928 RepID=A0A249PMK9_9HYPH|nr:hypothetical protein SJ05684_a38660 [Sinorhizobium sojae CCBAU 05684]ASY74125.1 hypothetical protein SF83666_a45380 [Sinorhizobium fredii CCBAU 83666]AWM29802.1 hypothetical protein AOX55_00004366 [Sinorhizobium fredii CCBAU 25509]
MYSTSSRIGYAGSNKQRRLKRSSAKPVEIAAEFAASVCGIDDSWSDPDSGGANSSIDTV